MLSRQANGRTRFPQRCPVFYLLTNTCDHHAIVPLHGKDDLILKTSGHQQSTALKKHCYARDKLCSQERTHL